MSDAIKLRGMTIVTNPHLGELAILMTQQVMDHYHRMINVDLVHEMKADCDARRKEQEYFTQQIEEAALRHAVLAGDIRTVTNKIRRDHGLSCGSDKDTIDELKRGTEAFWRATIDTYVNNPRSCAVIDGISK